MSMYINEIKDTTLWPSASNPICCVKCFYYKLIKTPF